VLTDKQTDNHKQTLLKTILSLRYAARAVIIMSIFETLIEWKFYHGLTALTGKRK